MPYKVEIHSSKTFPDGKLFNDFSEYYFMNDHELTANREAFDFAFFKDPEPNTEFEVTVYWGAESGYEKLLLCTIFIHSLDEYTESELEKREFYYCLELENLHKEFLDYQAYSFDTGGPPFVMKNDIIDFYDVTIRPTPSCFCRPSRFLSKFL